jgi:hypothetical protein
MSTAAEGQGTPPEYPQDFSVECGVPAVASRVPTADAAMMQIISARRVDPFMTPPQVFFGRHPGDPKV